MADLIAQGSQPQFRWRRRLPLDAPQVLGRASHPWSIPWDERISRKHAELTLTEGRLKIRLLPEARNPIFYRGRRSDNFEIQPGDHFVIGETTFTLANEKVLLGALEPNPITERTFSIEELHSCPYRRPDQRMEVLGRLPDVITSSANDSELYTRLVNLLLGGIGRAAAAAIVEIAGDDQKSQLKVLHWDRRILSGADFNPSERLIRQAVTTKQSVAYVWSGAERGPGDFTLSEGLDWAFCTPITGQACKGLALYVTGSFAGDAALDLGSDVESLGEEIKFTELTAATFSALREARFLARKQAGLSQFFSPVVLEALADQDADVVLQPREADVTVLFCDLRGFSRTSEKLSAQLHELLQRVSQALGVTTHHILQTGGVVGDFHGDAVMGFWGWPLPQADAVRRACQAALGIRAEFAAATNFRVGIGIATGRAVAGKIGTVDQVKVTVFGPVVNLASRLEGLTKDLRVPILLDEVTAAAARQQLPADVARLRQLAKVRPHGIETPVSVSELLPPLAEYPQLTDEHLAAFESAVRALNTRDWPRALQLLHQVPPDDLAKDFLTVFIAQHNRTPPENWDGVVPVGRN
ncbi:adenylate/guanylate cyclase domain-containing protein [Anatilimnocola floriformis]|uniref:adenylate/guanylate cyclase domain-containing protein n=1 Tax=Anatilimnocola floriformis TaxID=2948575 RepID=UPI0020C4B6E7|nr:adenylate/guanylate cyclase domain-containing protein [Anatilimnocola floriformis]